MNKLEFIQLANNQRKLNKNKWVQLVETVDGKSVQYKAFNTWIQILSVDGVKDSSAMDISVKQFNQFLTESI